MSLKLNLYSIKFYIGITISISWVLSTCVLSVSLMQLVNGAQFSNTYLLVLFAAASSAAMFRTAIVPLKCMYASLQLLKFDLIIDVLNLIILFS